MLDPYPARPHEVSPAVDDASLPAVLAAHSVVVLHLWAPWNGYDYAMAGMLRKLIPDYAGRIEFRSFDVDRGLDRVIPPRAIPTVNNVPAIVCFLRGEWHETVIGLRTGPEGPEG